jgi:putative effector of murein hydrolase/putative effector of murein hydrolase LrgA (UPF0299 family)
VVVDRILDATLAATGARFPGSVAGMLTVFAVLGGGHALWPDPIDRFVAWCRPGVDFLLRWLALFFVPALVLLPAAPVPSAGDVPRVVILIFGGFLFTLTTTAWIAASLPRRRVEAETGTGVSPGLPPLRLMAFWGIATVGSGAAWLALGTEIWRTAFFLAVTVGVFVSGVWIQNAVRRAWKSEAARGVASVAHPVVLSALAAVLVVAATGVPFHDYIRHDPAAPGAGDLLMALLDPAVVALGFLLFSRRSLLRAHATEILFTVGAASLLALLSSALMARWLELSSDYALAVIPRSVTAPIAMPIAELLGADPGVTAALVVSTGVLGAVFGRPVLRALGFHDSVVQGVAVGASAHGIGTAALVADDARAAAVAGVSFALMGAFSTVAVATPGVVELLWGILR